MPRYTIVIDWTDNGVSDADEIQVRADCAENAVRTARARWKSAIRDEWPGCRLVRAWVLTAEKLKKLA